MLAVANHNTAEQVVINGEKGPISRAVQLVNERAGRAIPLKVSGAWHCELMRGAVDDFRQFIEDTAFSKPETTVLFNATAKSETEPEKIKEIMARQLVSPVKWYDIMVSMSNDGADTFVEVGPKTVLTGLLKKSLPSNKDVKIYNVEGAESLKSFLDKA